MALAVNTPLTVEAGMEGHMNDIPVLAGARIFEGAKVGLQAATGYARPLVAGDPFLGDAYAEADNRLGASGAINVRVRQSRYRARVTIAGVAITDLGKQVFASADDTLVLTRSLSALVSAVGKVVRYVTTNTAIVEFEPLMLQETIVAELDCQTTIDTADHVLLPAWMNKLGVVVLGIFALVTEVFAGTEDQGVVTVYDEDDTALATLTATNAGADALGDIIVGYSLPAATTGDAGKVVAAGKLIDCKVTQATTGSASGKMKVYLLVRPLI